MLHALTVDVEDYFQVSGFEKYIRREDWGDFPCRVVDNTRRILDLLDQYQTKATFFVLGWIAEHYPQLVVDIHHAGHEIGSHSYWHRLVYTQTPRDFRDDLCRSRDILVDLLGERVVAYRAPSFSITQRSLWALDILVEEGFEIDSSIFPVRHDRYGIANSTRKIHRVETSAGTLWEFPPSVANLGGLNIPVGGGGYFRLYPFNVTKRWLTSPSRETARPVMVYIHPWELDPDQPRLRLGSRLTRFRHYVNLGSTERKLERLLSSFRFGTVSEVLDRSPAFCD